ncbi:hypothetical protein BH23ACT10_BH23ACT10_07220 [soil metagenome]
MTTAAAPVDAAALAAELHAARLQRQAVDTLTSRWPGLALTDAMRIDDGVVALDRFIHPKAEPEIAFLLGTDLVAPVTATDVRGATAAVAVCLEVVDSRYVGSRFGPLDNIADDSSAGAVVLGDPMALDDIDLRLLGVVVSVDGEVVDTAAGAAVYGDPAGRWRGWSTPVGACCRPGRWSSQEG